MNEFAILLVAAALAYGLARWSRLPALPLLIGAGIAIGAAGWLPEGVMPGGGGSGGPAAVRLLEFGLAFLVFASGVELNPRRFGRFRSPVLWIGVLQFGSCAVIGVATATWLGYPLLPAVYLGFALAASSTLVVLRHLQQRQAAFEPFGRVVTGVLLVQDLLMIVVIVVLARLDQGLGGLRGVAVGLFELVVLMGAAWLAQRRLIPALVARFKPDEEGLLLWLVASLFAFAWFAAWLGLPLIVGAFLGGFAFSAFPLSGLVRGQLASLSEFFQAIFFVALGALVGIPHGQQLVQALQLSAVVIVLTPPLVAALAEWRGLTARAAIESGLLLAQTSEFSLLLALTGLATGHLGGDVFGVIVLTTVITMTVMPFLGREQVAHALLPFHPLRRLRHHQADARPRNHVLILGYGTAGMWTVKPLRSNGHEVLVVDDDPVVCQKLDELGIPNLRGDGSDPATLARAGCAEAKLVIASMRRPGEALKMLECPHGGPVVVRVFEQSEADLVSAAGGIPILNSEAAAESFLEWLDANHPKRGQA